MILASRRSVLFGAAAASLALVGPALAEGPKVDLTDLLTPPEGGDMIVGTDTAKVTVVEYASATCPHCAKFYNEVFVNLKKDYIDTGKVRFIFREFPHNDAALAAFMVARCVPKEKYFPLVDVFFTTQKVWAENPYEGLKNIAQQAGMSAADFEACLKNEKVAKTVMAVRDKAANSYGVNGIPTIFINGKKYEGDPETYAPFKAAIDPLLG